jgi:hypothetical protein
MFTFPYNFFISISLKGRSYFSLFKKYSELSYFTEYAGNLGDAGDTDWREMEQQHILQLVDKF